MWHLFINSDNLFEFAFVSKGRYIVGSKQGYERRAKALSALKSINFSKHLGAIYSGHNSPGKADNFFVDIQDDTKTEPVILRVYEIGAAGVLKDKPGKRYLPTRRMAGLGEHV